MPETEAGQGAGTAFLILTLKEQGCLFSLSTPRLWCLARSTGSCIGRSGGLGVGWRLHSPALSPLTFTHLLSPLSKPYLSWIPNALSLDSPRPMPDPRGTTVSFSRTLGGFSEAPFSPDWLSQGHILVRVGYSRLTGPEVAASSRQTGRLQMWHLER